MDVYNKQFKKNLRFLMDKNNETREKLAEEIGVSINNIKSWLDKKSLPNEFNLQKLNNHYNILKSDYWFNEDFSKINTPIIDTENTFFFIQENKISAVLRKAVNIFKRNIKITSIDNNKLDKIKTEIEILIDIAVDYEPKSVLEKCNILTLKMFALYLEFKYLTSSLDFDGLKLEDIVKKNILIDTKKSQNQIDLEVDYNKLYLYDDVINLIQYLYKTKYTELAQYYLALLYMFGIGNSKDEECTITENINIGYQMMSNLAELKNEYASILMSNISYQ